MRDPLERFVSGFLDKCAYWFHADAEAHCEPHLLYRNGTRTGLLRDLSSNVQPSSGGATSKAALELFADTMPLRWNMHFLPQARMCDELGISLGRYSFVWVMNATFLAQVRQLVRAAGGNSSSAFAQSVKEAFLDRKSSLMQISRRSRPLWRNSSAVLEHVSRSAATRLLRLYSLDYVELGLPLPRWLGCLRDDPELP